ncbi:MAG: class GN sortase [Gammaproteobacteria bacterium]|nr:MAG: class GN sortase [Gammaproteobacteria bacterium]
MSTLFRKHTRKLTTIIIISLFATSLWQLASAGWIQGKAIIAQQLLNHSWNKTLVEVNGDKKPLSHKPWPWADTWTVAKLTVPQHNIEQIILAGDSGSSLAFGPGHSFASAAPNSSGTTVISAHRDTHFQFLKDLKVNEEIFIQTTDKTIAYKVYDTQVVDSKKFKLQPVSDRKTLVLVTCYPFDSLETGGKLRFLVYAAAT